MNHFVTSNKLVSHRQHLTLACTRVHQNPRTNLPSGLFQTTSELDLISFTSSIFKEIFQHVPDPPGANSALSGQHLQSSCVHCGWGWSSQSASLKVDPIHKWASSNQDAVTTRGPHNPHKGHSWSTQLRWSKRLRYLVPQDTYYIRPPYQDWES